MSGPPRTGGVEPVRRADGKPAFKARIRLADHSRVRIDVPEKYCTPAGGRTGRERAELYAQAAQEREDETGELLAQKQVRLAERRKKHDRTHGETCEQYFRRFVEHRGATGKVRRLSVWRLYLDNEVSLIRPRSYIRELRP
jgi:hypothetical protein